MMLLKWGIKYDNGDIKEFAGFSAYNKLIDRKICVNIQTSQEFEEGKVYAYFMKASDLSKSHWLKITNKINKLMKLDTQNRFFIIINKRAD